MGPAGQASYAMCTTPTACAHMHKRPADVARWSTGIRSHGHRLAGMCGQSRARTSAASQTRANTCKHMQTHANTVTWAHERTSAASLLHAAAVVLAAVPSPKSISTPQLLVLAGTTRASHVTAVLATGSRYAPPPLSRETPAGLPVTARLCSRLLTATPCAAHGRRSGGCTSRSATTRAMAEEAAVVPSCCHAAGVAVADRAARRCCCCCCSPMSKGWQSRCPRCPAAAGRCSLAPHAILVTVLCARAPRAANRQAKLLRRHGQQVHATADAAWAALAAAAVLGSRHVSSAPSAHAASPAPPQGFARTQRGVINPRAPSSHQAPPTTTRLPCNNRFLCCCCGCSGDRIHGDDDGIAVAKPPLQLPHVERVVNVLWHPCKIAAHQAPLRAFSLRGCSTSSLACNDVARLKLLVGQVPRHASRTSQRD